MNHHICFALIFLLFLEGCQLFTATNEEAESAVKQHYRITTTGLLGDFSEIGSVLTPRREGLRVNRPSTVFKPTVIKNHQITVPGGGDLLPGGIHDDALAIGERLYLYNIRTGRDYVQLDLFTIATYSIPESGRQGPSPLQDRDIYKMRYENQLGNGRQGPTPLQASVRFQYDGGLTSVTTKQLLDDIGEWLATQ